jgi:hypothetical protein
MIEYELAHLRFLYIRTIKGEYLSREDIDFVIKKKSELLQVIDGIEEILEIMTIKEREL